jgi:DNA-directed RNA polymerase specialized sigma24 family protein
VKTADITIGHLYETLRVKGATQPNLRHHRRTTGGDAFGDHTDVVHDAILELIPKIEAKKITGNLSRYINKAFRLHSIDARRKLSEGWAWKEFLMDNMMVPDNTEGQESYMSPREMGEASDYAAKNETFEQHGDIEPSESLLTAGRADKHFLKFGPRPSPLPFSAYLPDGGNGVSGRAASRATRAFLYALRKQVDSRNDHTTREQRAERDGLLLLDCLSPANEESRSQKDCAQKLGWSEAKASRMWSKLEGAIRQVADFYEKKTSL